MKLAVIHNPVSGKRSRELLDYALPRLEAGGFGVQVLTTTHPGHAEVLARQACDEVDMVVVAGGDGTVNEAMNGLVHSNVALGLLPVGTANILGYEIGIGTDLDKAVDTLIHGERRAVHVGWSGERYFLLMLGVGFDAEIVRGLNGRLKAALGKCAYVISGLKLMIQGLQRSLIVDVENERLSAQSVIVHNVRYYAGQFKVSPDADLDKPQFSVSVFTSCGRSKLIRDIYGFMRGKQAGLSDVRYLRTRHVKVGVEESMPEHAVQLDGDVVGTTPVDIGIAEKGLYLVRPN